MKRFILTAITLFFVLGHVLGSVKFESEILPILQEKCFNCHGETKQKSDLRLDNVEGIIRGGSSGEPLLVKGDPTSSLIINRIKSEDPDEKMPPEGKPDLTAEERLLVERWIQEGAEMPEPEKSIELTTDHWSFQRVVSPEIPENKSEWGNNEIDDFVLSKMASKKLSPSSNAEPRNLIRRIYQIMHGVPPSKEMITRHIKQIENNDWDSVVDEILASPLYGERFARHWLDIVRFAESNGFETNRERLTAYHFRDYVIRSFNNDLSLIHI